jgi:hypothetical protein
VCLYRFRINAGKGTFLYTGTSEWNELPMPIKTTSSLDSLKNVRTLSTEPKTVLPGNKKGFFKGFSYFYLLNQEKPIETQSLFFKGDLAKKAATINTLQN